MSSKTVQIDQLADAVVTALANYSKEATLALKDETKKAAKECAKQIKAGASSSFGGTGKYAKGWTSKKVFENADDVRYVVYNRTEPTLTHLLEYGHRKWLWGHPTGDMVMGVSHIRPVADMVGDDYVKNIKLRLG